MHRNLLSFSHISSCTLCYSHWYRFAGTSNFSYLLLLIFNCLSSLLSSDCHVVLDIFFLILFLALVFFSSPRYFYFYLIIVSPAYNVMKFYVPSLFYFFCFIDISMKVTMKSSSEFCRKINSVLWGI